jgi:hypothetical protein
MWIVRAGQITSDAGLLSLQTSDRHVSTTPDIYPHITKQGEREASVALEGWKSKRLKEKLG